MYVLKKVRAFEADVAEAAEWYNKERPGLGAEFVIEVQAIDQRLLANPLRYAVRFRDIRRINLRRFPYGIFFFLDGENIIVLAALHARRDTQAVLMRRRSFF